jgi:hypothetical protein
MEVKYVRKVDSCGVIDFIPDVMEEVAVSGRNAAGTAQGKKAGLFEKLVEEAT